ncbi:low molecular weight protein tyrosine phosphatase family protein [Pseudomonas sp. PDNC002]|uniref:low molecular weight protein tyrosine phosphatase family protein n=1 Tax=Pseudomonas sp. PDNC002 TaxID=2811422 RepID=UPI001966289C|nr:low molecular weight protein tyrosine phosphatase family protein [Pseudomonas sp. PDNC002]QRY76884.1 low molecular weight protein tyrosine phosphatase family protein [Pseudomonas sp. PDNC002]
MRRALFICSRNRLRSPTAETVFASWPEVETDSAGLAPDAEVPLGAEQLEWADLIFVMERRQRQALLRRFPVAMRGKRLVCLDIPDDYSYLQPELVQLLERKAGPFLRQERA